MEESVLNIAEMSATHWKELHYHKKVLIPQSGRVITSSIFSQSPSAKVQCLSSTEAKLQLQDHLKGYSEWPDSASEKGNS